MNNVWVAFITGLTTGGLSCLAVQGGLLASSISQEEEHYVDSIEKTKKWKTVTAFLVSKIFAYTMLGIGLGLIGATLTLSPKLLGWMQILAGLFMLATAARLLNINPIFRYFVIQPPKWALRLMREESKNKSLFAPAILGFLTILIPCGVTQAMMVLAIASGSPLYGALIMFAFTLGTSPIFFAMGLTLVELLKRKVFVYIASAMIIAFGLMSINAGQVIRGSAHTFQNYSTAFKSLFSNDGQALGISAQVDSSGTQHITLNVTSHGYSSDVTTLKSGVPVKITFLSNSVTSCARSFLIPSLGISKVLPENGTSEVEFTPTKTGLLSYTCGMGMYTGNFTVVN
ncbi:MAG TPA: sulfite exporter TauE/SafE family protein [Patescibacteria group bacterium]|nr:sulfite exporter TauE/SafE family protein [Patescibacteria group bacterium]